MAEAESPPQVSTAGGSLENEPRSSFARAKDAPDSDHESDLLSEIDENQFEDYDPKTANIEDRPVDIDEDIARTLKVSKRKRNDDNVPRRPKENRREKKRRDHDGNEVTAEITDIAGDASQRRARRVDTGDKRRTRDENLTNAEKEKDLSPEERRKRAIDRALDAAIKKPSAPKRRNKDSIDVDDEIDDRLADLKLKIERACTADNAARVSGQPALHKLKLLPEVIGILNRNDVQRAVLDPDTNFLQHVKFFLEPLNDGSLPAFNIQRDIFTVLTRLNVEKEALLSSGIGKLVTFYTRSKKSEPAIKRMAERLLGEWSRPILKRTDDYKKRRIETREYDHRAAKLAQRQKESSQLSLAQRPLQSARDALLAPTKIKNQARAVNLPSSYSIAPKSTFDGSTGQDHRPLGASGMEAFRRMTQKNKKRA